MERPDRPIKLHPCIYAEAPAHILHAGQLHLSLCLQMRFSAGSVLQSLFPRAFSRTLARSSMGYFPTFGRYESPFLSRSNSRAVARRSTSHFARVPRGIENPFCDRITASVVLHEPAPTTAMQLSAIMFAAQPLAKASLCACAETLNIRSVDGNNDDGSNSGEEDVTIGHITDQSK